MCLENEKCPKCLKIIKFEIEKTGRGEAYCSGWKMKYGKKLNMGKTKIGKKWERET